MPSCLRIEGSRPVCVVRDGNGLGLPLRSSLRELCFPDGNFRPLDGHKSKGFSMSPDAVRPRGAGVNIMGAHTRHDIDDGDSGRGVIAVRDPDHFSDH